MFYKSDRFKTKKECGPSVGAYNPKEIRHIPGLPASNDTRFKDQKPHNDNIGLDISNTNSQHASVANTPHNSRLKKISSSCTDVSGGRGGAHDGRVEGGVCSVCGGGGGADPAAVARIKKLNGQLLQANFRLKLLDDKPSEKHDNTVPKEEHDQLKKEVDAIKKEMKLLKEEKELHQIRLNDLNEKLKSEIKNQSNLETSFSVSDTDIYPMLEAQLTSMQDELANAHICQSINEELSTYKEQLEGEILTMKQLITDLKTQQTNSDNKIIYLNNKIEEQNQEFTVNDQELNEAKYTIHEMTQSLDMLSVTEKSLCNKIEQMDMSNLLLNNCLESMEKSKSEREFNLKNDLKLGEERELDLQMKYDNLQFKNSELHNILAIEKSGFEQETMALQGAKTELSILQEENARRRSNIDLLKVNHSTLTSKNVLLKNTMIEREAEVAELRAKIQSSQQIIENLAQNVAAANTRYTELESEFVAIESKLNITEDILSITKVANTDHRAQLEWNKVEKQQLNEELSNLKVTSDFELRQVQSKAVECQRQHIATVDHLRCSHKQAVEQLILDNERQLAIVEDRHSEIHRTSSAKFTHDLELANAVHETAARSLRESHEEVVRRLNREHSEQMDVLIREHLSDADCCEKVHKGHMTAVESTHRDEINALRERHDESTQKLESEYERRVSTLREERDAALSECDNRQRKEIATLRNNHARQQMDLVCNFSRTVDWLRSSVLSDNTECEDCKLDLQPIEFCDEEIDEKFQLVSANLRKLQEEFRITVGELQQSSEDTTAALQLKHDADLKIAASDRCQDLEKLTTEFRDKMKLEQTSAEETIAELRQSIENDSRQHQLQIERLQVEHLAEMDRSNDTCERMLKSADCSRARELQILTENHVEAIGCLRQQLDATTSAHDDLLSLADQRLAMNRKLTADNDDLSKQLQASNSNRDRHKDQADKFAQQLSSAHSQLLELQEQATILKEENDMKIQTAEQGILKEKDLREQSVNYSKQLQSQITNCLEEHAQDIFCIEENFEEERSRIFNLEQTISSLEEEKKRLQDSVSSKSTEIETLTANNTEMSEDNESLKTKYDELVKRMEPYERNMKILGIERDCIENEFMFARREADALAKNIGENHGHTNPKQKIKYVRIISEENNRLKFANQALKTNVDVLQMKNKSMQSNSSNLHKQTKASKLKRLSTSKSLRPLGLFNKENVEKK